MEHLVKMGHQRIVHLTEKDQFSFDKADRRRHFSTSMREHGLHSWAESILEVPFFSADSDLVNQILGLGATAVVAMNDLLALDLKAALVKM